MATKGRPKVRRLARTPKKATLRRRARAPHGQARVTATTIAAFAQDPDNLRRHTPRSLGVIEESIQAAGFGRSIVVDEKMRVLAGNGTLEAAASVGLTKAIVVDAPPDTLVAVQRKGLSPTQKRVLKISDNRANELSEFDGPRLHEALARLTGGDEDQLARLGFRKDDVLKLADLGPSTRNPGTGEPERCPRCKRLVAASS